MCPKSILTFWVSYCHKSLKLPLGVRKMGEKWRCGEMGNSGRISCAVLRVGISLGPHFLVQKPLVLWDCNQASEWDLGN